MHGKRKLSWIKAGIFVLLALSFLLLCADYRNRIAEQSREITRDDAAFTMGDAAESGYEPDDGAYKGKIALTFDDGPSYIYTEQLLNGLKKRNVKVTFFVTGQNVEKYPELVKRESEEGHLVGNHTYHHVQLTAANADVFRNEIVATNDIIEAVTGRETNFIRPPFGSWDKKYEAELNMFPVLWNIDPLDWCSTNVDKIVRTVVSQTEENSIILMHDCYESTVTAALQIIDILQAQGYEFVTVEEILFD